jgi:hypothetical protein
MNYEDAVTNEKIMQNHIDYESRSSREWSDFKGLVVNEIKQRLSIKSQSRQLKEIISWSFAEQQRALKELVVCETSILSAKNTVDRHKPARNLAVALAVEKLIPCILHMKMRLGEKLFHVIVNSGLQRYEDSKFGSNK